MPICSQCGSGFDTPAGASPQCPKCGTGWTHPPAGVVHQPFPASSPPRVGDFFLIVGAVLCVIGCVYAVVKTVYLLVMQAQAPAAKDGSVPSWVTLGILVDGVAWFLTSAALLVVFVRVRRIG